MTHKRFLITDKVRVQGTSYSGTVIKSQQGYAFVRFEDGKEAWFTQATGKESGGRRYILNTTEVDIEKAREIEKEQAQKRAHRLEVEKHNDDVRDRVRAEQFRRFLTLQDVPDVKIIATTELEGLTTVVFSATPLRSWPREEGFLGTKIYTVVIKPDTDNDWEASYQKRLEAQENGTFDSEADYTVYRSGYRVVLGSTSAERSTSHGQSRFFETVEEGLFSLLGDDFATMPTLEEMGLELLSYTK